MLRHRKPFIDEYLRSVSWTEMLTTLGERRPLIFIITNPKAQVKEVVVKEESDLAYAKRIGNMKPSDILNEKVANFTAKAVEETTHHEDKKEEAEELPPLEPKHEPKEHVAAEIIKEAVAEVAKKQGNEGEVSVGRWVEFEADDKTVKQGRVSFITPDEQSFLLVQRDGNSTLVKADRLISLIPEIV